MYRGNPNNGNPENTNHDILEQQSVNPDTDIVNQEQNHTTSSASHRTPTSHSLPGQQVNYSESVSNESVNSNNSETAGHDNAIYNDLCNIFKIIKPQEFIKFSPEIDEKQSLKNPTKQDNHKTR